MLITRRFTPPTCTLEIEAISSSLSVWRKHKAIKDVHFQLSFDDPRLKEEEQVTIQGDRTQLEQLYQAVTTYVQNFLQQSNLEQILSLSPSSTTIKSGQPYLQPQGLVAHELFLGSLGDNNSGDKIKLNTVQLFDLVTVLEDYQVEITATVNINSLIKKKFIVLATSVASIFVVAGLTILGFNLFNQSSTNLKSASSLQESESALNKSNSNRYNVIPPQVTKSPEQPATQRQLKDPLASKEQLPPPPPVDLPKPPPANVPDFSKYPLPKPNQIPNIKTRITSQAKPKESSNPSSESEIALNSQEDNIRIPDLPPLSSSLLPTEADIIDDSYAKTDNKDDNLEQEQSVSATLLKEVKQYFRQQWQPPAELKQTIEYRLVINSQGSIVRITPIGKASAIFLDRTNIPLMGESFISPRAVKGNQTIRLLLSPDGEVKTFLENN